MPWPFALSDIAGKRMMMATPVSESVQLHKLSPGLFVHHAQCNSEIQLHIEAETSAAGNDSFKSSPALIGSDKGSDVQHFTYDETINLIFYPCVEMKNRGTDQVISSCFEIICL